MQVCLRYAHKLLKDSSMAGATAGKFLEEWRLLIPEVSLPKLPEWICQALLQLQLMARFSRWFSR